MTKEVISCGVSVLRIDDKGELMTYSEYVTGRDFAEALKKTEAMIQCRIEQFPWLRRENFSIGNYLSSRKPELKMEESSSKELVGAAQ